MILKAVAATLGVLGYSIALFHIPKRSYTACASCGGGGFFLYLYLSEICDSFYVAAIIAAIIVTVVARILAVALQMPATIFLVSGILPLVPGSSIYYTMYYLITDHQWEMFKSKGLEALGLAGGIALGIILGSEIPQTVIRKVALSLQNMIHFKHRIHH